MILFSDVVAGTGLHFLPFFLVCSLRYHFFFLFLSFLAFFEVSDWLDVRGLALAGGATAFCFSS